MNSIYYYYIGASKFGTSWGNDIIFGRGAAGKKKNVARFMTAISNVDDPDLSRIGKMFNDLSEDQQMKVPLLILKDLPQFRSKMEKIVDEYKGPILKVTF